MPTIPDVSRLKRAIPEDMTTVTRVDTSDVGRGTEALGRAFKDIADDRDEYELNKAEANYLIAKTKEDNAYKDDEDYATIPQRYEENTSKLMSDISAKITNPRVREQFLLRQRQNQAVGIERIKALASDKERDFERGEILNIENDLFDVGVQGNIVEAVKQYERVLDSGHKYISKEEKAKRVESFKERASTAWIKSKEPEQQLELLKSPGAKHLPADVKIELKKKAKEKLREHKAIDIVDDIRNRDLPPGDAFNEVRQKYQDDPELRQDIEARLEYEFTVDRNSEIDAQRTIFQDVYLPVRQGKDINDPEIQAAMRVMTPDQVRSMYNAAAAAAGGGSRGTAKTSPRWLVNELNRLHAQGAHDEVSALFLEDNNFEKLSTSDFNVWSKNTAEGLVDPEAKSINNDHRAIQQRMISRMIRVRSVKRYLLVSTMSGVDATLNVKVRNLPTSSVKRFSIL